MQHKLTQQKNLDELMKQTLLNILSAKGIIYTYYKNKKIKKVIRTKIDKKPNSIVAACILFF